MAQAAFRSAAPDREAIDWLAAKGYDPAYGARPLKRVMQKELQDPLAERILLGEILDGSTMKVTAGSDRLNFRANAGEPAETEKAA
jgi:ATP-dependent Clp protease ATP-binding subunit ClpB